MGEGTDMGADPQALLAGFTIDPEAPALDNMAADVQTSNGAGATAKDELFWVGGSFPTNHPQAATAVLNPSLANLRGGNPAKPNRYFWARDVIVTYNTVPQNVLPVRVDNGHYVGLALLYSANRFFRTGPGASAATFEPYGTVRFTFPITKNFATNPVNVGVIRVNRILSIAEGLRVEIPRSAFWGVLQFAKLRAHEVHL